MCYSRSEDIYYKEAVYDVEADTLHISLNGEDLDVGNCFQYEFSNSGKYVVYSVSDAIGVAPDLFLYDSENKSTKRITDNRANIEYDPVVFDDGAVAYVLWDKKKYPKLMVNDIEVPNSDCSLYYSDLIADKNQLYYIGTNYKNGKARLFSMDIDGKSINYLELTFFPNKMCLKDDYIYLTGIDCKGANVLYRIPLTLEVAERIYISSDNLMLSSKTGNANLLQISGNDDGIHLMNAWYYMFGAESLNPFAQGTNFYGRLSWYQSARLLGLIELFKKTQDGTVKSAIADCVKELWSARNDQVGIYDDGANPGFMWSTTCYGLDTTKPDCLLCNQASIYNALLEAVEAGLVDEELSQSIVDGAVATFAYYEQDWNQNDSCYHFRYGGNFYLDGVCLPFNQQNILGVMCCHLYKLTGDDKYHSRAKALARLFKSQFVYTDDGRLIWHYWPEQFYKGWSADDKVSVHTPERKASIDSLYEDTSHAAENVAFILEYTDTFGDEVFSVEDISKLEKTLDRIFDESLLMSRFISGDKEYSPLSCYYYIGTKWASIKSPRFNEYSLTLRDYFPLYDQSLLLLQSKCIHEVESAKINVRSIPVENVSNERADWSDDGEYVGSDIKAYVSKVK